MKEIKDRLNPLELTEEEIKILFEKLSHPDPEARKLREKFLKGELK